MKRKQKPKFRLDSGVEKSARLDVRITEALRKKLEAHCRKNRLLLTNAVTEALESYLESD